MNKGLYKANGYIFYWKSWKNSSENSGVSIELKNSNEVNTIFNWKNVPVQSRYPLIGATCLAQW